MVDFRKKRRQMMHFLALAKKENFKLNFFKSFDKDTRLGMRVLDEIHASVKGACIRDLDELPLAGKMSTRLQTVVNFCIYECFIEKFLKTCEGILLAGEYQGEYYIISLEKTSNLIKIFRKIAKNI